MNTIPKNLSVFPYFGSKRDIAQAIADRLNVNGRPFCEVFTGGATVSLCLASLGQLRQLWLNDFDIGIASLWRCIADDDLVERVIGRMPRVMTQRMYGERLMRFGEMAFDVEAAAADDLVEAAALKLSLLWASFSCIVAGNVGNYDPKRWPTPEYIRQRVRLGNRLLRGLDVRVTNWSFERLIPEARSYVLYMDPPYYDIRGGYYHDFQFKHHLRLMSLLRGRKRWLLSYDDYPVVRWWYRWANVETTPVRYSAGGKRTGNELLIAPRCG